MKKTLIMLSMLPAICLGYAITPQMVLRNGLTDEQYENYFRRNPDGELKISASTWRRYRFIESRWDNVVEWLNIAGPSNNFGAVLASNVSKMESLAVSNATLKAFSQQLYGQVEAKQAELSATRAELEETGAALTNAVAQLSQNEELIGRLSNTVYKVKSGLQEKRDEYQQKYNSGSAITKPIYKGMVEVYDALLDKFDEED